MSKRRIKGKVAVTNPEQPKEINILQQHINIRPVNRQSSDIQSWKNAIQSAESINPRRTSLYDLYDNILLDGHLTGIVEKYINAVVGAEWEFSKEGEVIPLVNDMIDTNEFEEVLRGIVEAKLWGITWFEFTNFTKNGFDVWKMPRKHIRPKEGILASEQSGDTGINIREGIYAKTCLEVGKPDDLGLLMKVAQYVIYKRGGFGDWAQFAEIFGMPFRIGEYDTYDEAQRIQLEKALEEAGSAAYAVIPKGSNIRFEKNASTGDGQLFKLLKDACNQEMSVTILGVTETTTSSSSSGYAQSETHNNEQERGFKGLRDYTRRILNRKFIPILEANGVNTEGGYFIVKGEGEERLSLKERFEIHKSMVKDLGLPMDDNSFYETYGMTKPEDYEQQKNDKKAANSSLPNAQAIPQTENSQPDKAELSKASLNLWQKAKHFFDHALQG
ncbi:DUF935 family protein [Olivibacter sp. 47]|uniref:phage portal protein family protein n=1 Tax=Olivibacter sp. 47 TaxID=3056486 RepID=UPI0025A48CD0|nr:DUF935 family protein [Olivibacter sp. 47]MDM8176855.1 DUF935 family protein [Olivibacter sp. 47]